MRSNFDRALKLTLQFEGGYVHNPHDPGGATNYGITQHTYDAWRKHGALQTKSVRDISHQEVAAIYEHEYWDAVRGDKLPVPLDMAMFDFAVNSGPRRAIKTLQRLVCVEEDGVIGVVTLTAVADFGDPVFLAHRLNQERSAFLHALPTWKHFGKGWSNRVAALDKTVRETTVA